MRVAAKNCKKALKLPTFGNLQSFKVIEVDSTKKTSHCLLWYTACLQPLSR